MKVVREITFEGDEKQLLIQCKNSAPNGKYLLSLRGLSITIKTLECPTEEVMNALNYAPSQWPVQYRVDDTDTSEQKGGAPATK